MESYTREEGEGAEWMRNYLTRAFNALYDRI